ncbi:MAG: ribonuclease [Saccharofermentans sp.]|nr:ribonuclease [Saccharofermentans sp.]
MAKNDSFKKYLTPKNIVIAIFVIIALIGFLMNLGNDTGVDETHDVDIETTTEEVVTTTSTKATETTPEATTETTKASETTKETEADLIDKDGVYTKKDDVALYIYTYGELPSNFMTKKEAQKLGWEGGSLEPYAPGMCIGGDYFGNYEGLLPEKKGREYHECDIDTLGAKSRGAKRIIFSNDGLIYYTSDHYESFTLLYGEE